jgi:hypothetical protein
VPSLDDATRGSTSTIYMKPHDSFLLGVLLTTIHTSLIVGPDFLENVFHIVVLFSFKFSLGLLYASAESTAIIPVGTIFLIYSVFNRH